MTEIPAFKQILEAAILAADKPLSIDALIQLFEGDQPARADIRKVLAEIQEDCVGRGFELKEVASGYRFQVRSEFSEWVDRLWEEKPQRYTRAFLETLALIAYKQPITRGDIEEIRGVSVSTNIMRSLMEREWIRIVGHRDVPGRPAIFATTRAFLDYFDLSNLDELPSLSEIKDLDKMTEQLDLGEEELIEPRSLDLEAEDSETMDNDADDAMLEDVTNRVNTIQENIRNMLRESEEEELGDESSSDEDSEVASPLNAPGSVDSVADNEAADEEQAEGEPAIDEGVHGDVVVEEDADAISSATQEPDDPSDG